MFPMRLIKYVQSVAVALTNGAGSVRIERVLPKSGPVAQLGARFHGMEEVIGSIPIRSTNYFNNLDDLAILQKGPKSSNKSLRSFGPHFEQTCDPRLRL